MNAMCGIEKWDGLSALLFGDSKNPGRCPGLVWRRAFGPCQPPNQKIPLPPPTEQRQIVAELDAEAAQIESVRALIPRYEAKIQRLLARVWGTK